MTGKSTINKVGVFIPYLRFPPGIEDTWDLPVSFTPLSFGAPKPWANDEVGWQKVRSSKAKRRPQKYTK
jgi:hypothetical protein